MIGASASAGGEMLLRALSVFTNLVLAGETPAQVCPVFFGASLTALNKKDGGVRLIAVGCTLHRLVAKMAGNAVMQRMGSLLAPLQLGYGTPLGAEAAAHSARVYLEDLPDDNVLFKLDFKNAFNSIRRDKMLEAAREAVPEMFPYIYSLYSVPSTLRLNARRLGITLEFRRRTKPCLMPQTIPENVPGFWLQPLRNQVHGFMPFRSPRLGSGWTMR